MVPHITKIIFSSLLWLQSSAPFYVLLDFKCGCYRIFFFYGKFLYPKNVHLELITQAILGNDGCFLYRNEAFSKMQLLCKSLYFVKAKIYAYHGSTESQLGSKLVGNVDDMLTTGWWQNFGKIMSYFDVCHFFLNLQTSTRWRSEQKNPNSRTFFFQNHFFVLHNQWHQACMLKLCIMEVHVFVWKFRHFKVFGSC